MLEVQESGDGSARAGQASKSSVGYNVTTLSREGLLRTERDGLKLRGYPTALDTGWARVPDPSLEVERP